MKISQFVKVLGVAATAVTAYAPQASAQQNYGECSVVTNGSVGCFGARLTLLNSNMTAQLDLQNTSPTAGGGRISGFALYDLSSPFLMVGAGSTITAQYFNGSSFTTLANFAAAGTSSGLITGSFPSGSVFQYVIDGGQGGITPCGAGQLGSGTNQATCPSTFVRFTITNISGVSSASDVNLAVRFQTVGTNGQGSLKCYTSEGINGDDCSPTPGGGGIQGTVTPEPATYAMLGTGLLGLMGVAARRRRQS